jgi:hypothetical protein
MSERTAIVTLAIGEEHSHRWHQLCEENWHRYADRHGYDVVCIEEPLDTSERAAARSPSWQKLLVAAQPFAEDYERIAWVDADALFGRDAAPIAHQVPEHLVGAVDEVAMMRPDIRRMLHPDPPSEYRGAGLPEGFDQVVQGGVLVFSPSRHGALLERTYREHEDNEETVYEMRPLSYELIRSGLVHWLDPTFNMLWFVYRAHNYPELARYRRHPKARAALDTALDQFAIVHFAGEAYQMEFLRTRPRRSATPSKNPPRTRTPVALFIHDRPDETSRVLDAIRGARPTRLLIVGDAPREEVPGEGERCRETRALIETVDWDCEVETDYSARNLGPKDRIQSGLDWVFSRVEEAIIFEADCLPDPSFFPFCEELLKRYRSDDRVMSIAGTNFQFDRPASSDSYYFSRHSLIWGWATWRDARAANDPELTAWPELRDRGWLNEILPERYAAAYWSHVLERTYRERDTWDRAWQLSCWLRGGLHAIPNVNLVRYIGFHEGATHTTPATGGRLVGDLPTEPIEFPLRHPADVRRNAEADSDLNDVLFGGTVSDMFDRVLLARRGMAAVR